LDLVLDVEEVEILVEDQNKSIIRESIQMQEELQYEFQFKDNEYDEQDLAQ